MKTKGKYDSLHYIFNIAVEFSGEIRIKRLTFRILNLIQEQIIISTSLKFKCMHLVQKK